MVKATNKTAKGSARRFLQLGIGSYTYGWQVGIPDAMPARPLSVEDLIAKASALNLSLIQIGDNHPLATYENSRLSDIKARLRAHPLSVEIGARGLTTRRLKESMELAEYFHASLLRFIIDGADYEPDAAEIIAIIKERVKALERRGITLAIENHDRIHARDLADIVRSIDSNHVGVCLDTVNSLGAGEGLDTVLEHLVPHTVNLHIKDFTIIRLPHKMGFNVEGKQAGSGLLDIPGLLERIASTGKCHTAILEQWVPPEKSVEQTVIKEEQWAVESLNYLKKIGEWR